MLQRITTKDEGTEEGTTASATLDELARAGAQRMIGAAVTHTSPRETPAARRWALRESTQ